VRSARRTRSRLGLAGWGVALLVAAALAVVLVSQRSPASQRRDLKDQLRTAHAEILRSHAQLRRTRSELRAAPVRETLRDRRFEIAFLEGDYQTWLNGRLGSVQGAAKIAAATRDGHAQRGLVRTSKGITGFNWARHGAAVDFARNTVFPYQFELRPDDGLVHALPEMAYGDVCISSPDAARNGARLTCDEGGAVYVWHGRSNRLALIDHGIGDTSKEEPTLSPGGNLVAYVEVAGTDPLGYSLSRLNLRSHYHRPLATVDDPLPNLSDMGFEWKIDRIAWSPDSHWLAFSAHDGDGAREAIFRVDADGRGFRRLIPNAGRPTFSPDGKLLAFDSARAGRRAVFVAHVDGTHIRRISHGSLDAFAARWRPRRGGG
jgi:WD40-like Beta Propeller Repeat